MVACTKKLRHSPGGRYTGGSYSGMIFLQNFFYGIQEHIHLLVSADGNAQEIVDPGLSKVPHQYTSLPQSQEELFARNAGMGRKDEVCLGGQDRKPKFL
jgi:hypothetical protein